MGIILYVTVPGGRACLRKNKGLRSGSRAAGDPWAGAASVLLLLLLLLLLGLLLERRRRFWRVFFCLRFLSGGAPPKTIAKLMADAAAKLISGKKRAADWDKTLASMGASLRSIGDGRFQSAHAGELIRNRCKLQGRIPL
jgi:hypothetical protein